MPKTGHSVRKLPRISDAEWLVMHVVWERAPVTAADVVEALTPATGWNHRTIRTMLNRLARKGALVLEEDGNRYLYRAGVARGECVHAETRSFLERVFSGHAASLLVHCVERCDLSKAELDGLRRLLAEKRPRAKE